MATGESLPRLPRRLRWKPGGGSGRRDDEWRLIPANTALSVNKAANGAGPLTGLLAAGPAPGQERCGWQRGLPSVRPAPPQVTPLQWQVRGSLEQFGDPMWDFAAGL